MAAAVARRRGGSGLSLCLASAGVVKTLALAAFTLVWTHSIEKVDWQEDWRITPDGLELMQARVKGSGAGMEPPPDARLIDGWFRWQPGLKFPRSTSRKRNATRLAAANLRPAPLEAFPVLSKWTPCRSFRAASS